MLNTQTSYGTERNKGMGFPNFSLEKAIRIVSEASKTGNSFSRETFACFGVKKGATSAKSGAYLVRLATLKDFGLIETSKDKVILTELAHKIIYPKNEEESKSALEEAFLRSDIFARIYHNVAKNEPVLKENIKNLAVRDYRISSKSQNVFIRSFVESANYADLAEDRESTVIFKGVIDNKDVSIKKETSVSEQRFSLGLDKNGKGWKIVFKIEADFDPDELCVEETTKLLAAVNKLAKKLAQE